MSITNLNELINAQATAQTVSFYKSASRTSVANIPFSVFDLAGNPGAGTLAVGNTTDGIVPQDTTAGYPLINAFTGANNGYISRIEFNSTVLCNLLLFDTVFSCGAYAFNADTTLGTPPSYASRVPGGNYTGLQLWIEAVTAFTGNQTVQINYLDQDGNAGDTGAIATGVAPTIGRMLQLPLAAGDNGVAGITRIRSSVSTVGTFNVHVLRPLWSGRIVLANYTDTHDFTKTGLPEIYATSALRLLVQADSTATGLPRLNFDIVNG